VALLGGSNRLQLLSEMRYTGYGGEDNRVLTLELKTGDEILEREAQDMRGEERRAFHLAKLSPED
jgi:hypothetical protein